jgi:hypothetical protein
MVGIDLYGWDFRDTGIKEYWNASETYQDAFDVIKQLAPEKLIIMTETDALPNMEKTFNEHPNFAKWLWVMPWWAANENNPEEWIKKTYTHENIIMQPDLPDFTKLATGKAKHKTSTPEINFTLYPVPCSDVLFVKPAGSYELQVFNSAGKLLNSINSSSEITTSFYQPGIYFLKINGVKNTVFKKFVKI